MLRVSGRVARGGAPITARLGDGSLDVLSTVLELGGPAIVRSAKQAQVLAVAGAAFAAWMAVIVFQPATFFATVALVIDPAAA